MPEKNMQATRKAETSQGATQDLIDAIKENGPVTVSKFMALSANHYYATQSAFGIEGDFTTAPEVSQMFGEMIGAWFVDLWMQMKQPEKIQLIELGPGRGTLMADIMRTFSAWPALKEAVSIHLVETSQRLKDLQATTLSGYRPTWYDSFDEIPEGISFIVANEFFDALSVHQFRKSDGVWKERCVDYDDVEDAFVFTTKPIDFDIATVMPEGFLTAQDGCIFEVSPAILSVTEKISKRIETHGGAGLVIDYGHAVTGLGDTLQSVQKHTYSDPLESPGTKDITAHVDFSVIKTTAEQYVDVYGAITQGQFLTNLGIVQRAQTLAKNATPQQRKEIELALYRLTSVTEMGALFKVLGLIPSTGDIIPAGFDDNVTEQNDQDTDGGDIQ